MQLNFHTFRPKGFADKAGAAVSWICAAHCLAMPLIVSFFPLLGISFLAQEGIEYIFIGLSIAIAMIGLLPAYFKKHHKIRTLLLFSSGIIFIIFSDIIFEDSFTGKIFFVLSGAICVTSAHFVNRRLCETCCNCTENECH